MQTACYLQLQPIAQVPCQGRKTDAVALPALTPWWSNLQIIPPASWSKCCRPRRMPIFLVLHRSIA